MIQINYPGVGNDSQFAYDGHGQNVKIQKYSNGTSTALSYFVWSKHDRCVSRNVSGGLIGRYFRCGQTISGTNYFYSRNHEDSITVMTDGSGSVQSELAYTPDGRVSQVQGSQSSEFQYAGYYFHGRSGLNLTLTRAYNATLNKWISRDKIGELGGTNLFAYASNNPVSFIDPSGKADIGNYITQRQSKA